MSQFYNSELFKRSYYVEEIKSMYPIYLLLVAVFASVIQIQYWHTPTAETFLLWVLICNVGLQGIYAFIGHFFFADDTARKIGWTIRSPFQTEIAFTNLSLGIQGILCIWIHGYFWLAVILGRTIFTWGAAYVHIVDIIKRKNFHPYNSGPVLWFGIGIPILLITLYISSTIL